MKRILLTAIASACIGAFIGAVLVYRFYTGFMDQSLALHSSTELGQDIAMYRALQKADYDKVSNYLRMRMVGNAFSLQAQCDRLATVYRTRANEQIRELKELGVDVSKISYVAELGVSLDGCG